MLTFYMIIMMIQALVVSRIAHSDWPDHYPSLLSDLLSLLQSSSSDAIHGALQVLSDLSREELTEEQLIPVLRELVPILITILGQPDVTSSTRYARVATHPFYQQHTNFTRARAVAIFRQSVASLIMVKDQYPDAANEASSSVLPQWFDAFRVLLDADPLTELRVFPDWSPLALRLQIFRVCHYSTLCVRC